MKTINRQARFDYELKDRLEVGVVLSGAETKSAKNGSLDLNHAFCKFRDGELWIYNLHIYPYAFANNESYQPDRARKLLLAKKEAIALQSRMKQGRLLLVPTAVYTKKGLVKIEVALARGKRKYEKREAIKKRDLDREMGGGGGN